MEEKIDYVGLAANLNACTSAVISIVLNAYVMIAVNKGRINSTLGLYKWMMLLSAAFDIIYSVLLAATCPTIASVDEWSSVLFVNGGLLTSYDVGQNLLMVWIILLCISMVMSPCLFVCRYLQVCRTHWLKIHGKRTLYIFIIPLFLSISAATMLIFAAYPSDQDIEEFKNLAYYINTKGFRPFFVASLYPEEGEESTHSRVLIAACVNLVFNLVCGIFAMLFCTRCMLAVMKKCTSSKSMLLQTRLQKLLIVQFLIPFISIHVPFCSCCLAPLLHLEIRGVADFLPFLFAWSPVLNPAAVLYFVKELWRPLQKLLSFSKVVPMPLETTTDVQGNREQPGDYQLNRWLVIYPLLFVNKLRLNLLYTRKHSNERRLFSTKQTSQFQILLHVLPFALLSVPNRDKPHISFYKQLERRRNVGVIADAQLPLTFDPGSQKTFPLFYSFVWHIYNIPTSYRNGQRPSQDRFSRICENNFSRSKRILLC